MPLRFPLFFLALLSTLLLSGCGEKEKPASVNVSDRRPNLEKVMLAKSGKGSARFKEAAEEYRAYLAGHPRDADGHLELGMLLVDTEYYGEGLFHLRTFLSAAPTSSKAALAQEYIDKATAAFSKSGKKGGDAATEVSDTELVENIRAKNVKIGELNKEIEALQQANGELAQKNEDQAKEIERLEKRVKMMLDGGDASPSGPRRSPELNRRQLDSSPAPSHPSPSGIQRAAAETKPAVPVNPKGTYEVRAGDSLSSIANKVYGNVNKASDIRRVNPGKIGPNDSLKAGTILVLP